MKGTLRRLVEGMASVDRIYRRAACHNLSTLSGDNTSPIAILGQVEVRCLELVISTSSVDS